MGFFKYNLGIEDLEIKDYLLKNDIVVSQEKLQEVDNALKSSKCYENVYLDDGLNMVISKGYHFPQYYIQLRHNKEHSALYSITNSNKNIKNVLVEGKTNKDRFENLVEWDIMSHFDKYIYFDKQEEIESIKKELSSYLLKKPKELQLSSLLEARTSKKSRLNNSFDFCDFDQLRLIDKPILEILQDENIEINNQNLKLLKKAKNNISLTLDSNTKLNYFHGNCANQDLVVINKNGKEIGYYSTKDMCNRVSTMKIEDKETLKEFLDLVNSDIKCEALHTDKYSTLFTYPFINDNMLNKYKIKYLDSYLNDGKIIDKTVSKALSQYLKIDRNVKPFKEDDLLNDDKDISIKNSFKR